MSTTAANNYSEIDLDTMSIDQLNQLQQDQEGRLQALLAHLGRFRQAAAQLSASQRAVQNLSSSLSVVNDNNNAVSCFVPLTESVYVPAKLNTTKNNKQDLLIDLGTGYYVEQSAVDTLQYLERKQRLVDMNSDNCTAAIQGTRRNIQAITNAMQGKLLEIRARQQGRLYQKAVEEE